MHYSLCDMFSDLTQNSIEAGASVVTVRLIQDEASVRFSVEDNGKGMSIATLQKASDPFYTDGVKHPGRKVGLGIPFLIQTAEETGGSWKISSRAAGAGTAELSSGGAFAADTHPESGEGTGTFLACAFDLTNIDLPPLGDVPGFFRQCLAFPQEYEMVVERKAPWTEYTLKRSELLDALGLDGPEDFSEVSVLHLMGTYLESLESEEGEKKNG